MSGSLTYLGKALAQESPIIWKEFLDFAIFIILLIDQFFFYRGLILVCGGGEIKNWNAVVSLPGNVGKIAVLDSRYIIQMQIHLHGFAFLFQEMGTWSLLGCYVRCAGS